MSLKVEEFKSYVDSSLSKIERDDDLEVITKSNSGKENILDEKYLKENDLDMETLGL